MPGGRTETLVSGSFIKEHQFVPLVKSAIVCAVDRIVIVTILLNNAVIPLILGRCNDGSIVQICSQPALRSDMDCLIYLVVSYIREWVSASEDGGWKIVDRD